MVSALETMKKHYRDRDLAIRSWREKGGKVVGYVYPTVPTEIMTAAGLLPVMVTGNPEIPTEEGDRYMEDFFCPFVRSLHDLFVRGRYGDMDLVVLPHGNDSVSRCYYYLCTEKEYHPELKVPPLYYFDILHTKRYIANRYTRGRVAALKEKLETLSGKEITNEALLSAISVHNENRRLLKQVAALRRADPPRISGTDALQIIGCSFLMAKEEHNKLLREFLDQAGSLPPVKGVRIYVAGTIIDNTQLYELIESCGAVVVSEDVCTGDRFSDNPVDTTLEPLDALTERYHMQSHDGRMYPMNEHVDYLLRSAGEVKPDGVIFNYLKWDDAHGWHYPGQRDALKNAGIPSVAFDMQEYKIENPEQLRTRIEAFVEILRGGN
jgi:benzoyl-CoA reductase/2-hydroxyglutaryl-CoA dehydratase subunit BcrC/BadD/HgdB